MKRSELKQLIREAIEEISADTARRAAEKATQLGRNRQADRLTGAAEKKDTDAIGGDPSIESFQLNKDDVRPATIKKLGRADSGVPGILIDVDGREFILIDNDPLITTARGSSVRVGRADRIKLVKAFKKMGVNVNANKINIIEN
jgi:hypothetical protein